MKHFLKVNGTVTRNVAPFFINPIYFYAENKREPTREKTEISFCRRARNVHFKFLQPKFNKKENWVVEFFLRGGGLRLQLSPTRLRKPTPERRTFWNFRDQWMRFVWSLFTGAKHGIFLTNIYFFSLWLYLLLENMSITFHIKVFRSLFKRFSNAPFVVIIHNKLQALQILQLHKYLLRF